MMLRRRNSFALTFLLAAMLWNGSQINAVANPTIYEVGDDPSLGFNLISWSSGSTATTFQNAVQSIHDAGFRDVSISPVQFFNTTTFAIAPNSSSPSLSAIEAGVVKAKQLGMRVTLNPFVEPQNFVAWRATYNPSGAAATQFWGDYQNYLVAVAQIGEAHGVEAMNVGTELNGMADSAANSSHWNDVINAVDAVYHGQIGYASNWSDYNNAAVKSSIWQNPKVDYIGTDSYFTNVLSGWFKHLNPSFSNSQINALVDSAVSPIQSFPDQSFIDLMTNAWNYKLDNELLPFAASIGKPIVFTEQGYDFGNTTAQNPQVTPNTVDTAEQRMSYQGLLNALDHRANKFEGLDVWQWGMPGSDGSQWNMGLNVPSTSYQNANNQPLTQLLSNFVNTAVLPLAGDYNRDGIVDAADYTTWRDLLGKFVTNYNTADGNGNGVIDQADYDVWAANFGATLSGGAGAQSTPVPEPPPAVLAVIALAISALSSHCRNACAASER